MVALSIEPSSPEASLRRPSPLVPPGRMPLLACPAVPLGSRSKRIDELTLCHTAGQASSATQCEVRESAFFATTLFAALAALFALTGCAVVRPSSSWASNFGIVPRTRYDSLQTQNRTLAERARAQQTEIENLKIHSRNVEDQLIRAEEDLAKLDDRSHRQQQKLANFKREHDELDDRYGRAGQGTVNSIPAGLSGRLSDLAERYPSLHYDPKSGISKFDTDVLFDSGEADLTPSARRMLGEFADIFQAPEARDLKIMVVGHTDGRGIKGREARQKYPNNWHLSAARAVAVVERLREAGLPENRMGVAGFAQHQPISPNDTATSRKKNRRVEIFVVGPETPVVGWTETLNSVYR